jgi:hypothetical protein
MRTLPLILAIALLAVPPPPAAANDRIDTFDMGVASYFDRPLEEVLEVRDRVPRDELPVVFFLADRADVPADRVVDMRAAGRSWQDIGRHLDVAPKDYYVKLKHASDLPRDGVWRDLAATPKRDWSDLRFDDGDVVDVVNLRFLSDAYEVDKRDVVAWRARGADYPDIARRSAPKRDWVLGHGPDGWILHDYRRGHGPDGWVHDRHNPHDWQRGHRPRPDRPDDGRGDGHGDGRGDGPPSDDGSPPLRH